MCYKGTVMQPTLFRIPGLDLPVYSYGVMFVVGFLAAVGLAAWRARRADLDVSHVIDLALVSFISGMLGARLFFYLQFYDRFFADAPWWAILAVWEGGVVWYGGLIGATLAGLGFLWLRGLPVLHVADIVAPAVVLGQAFGRVGCFLNGCCWGTIIEPSHWVHRTFPGLTQFPRIARDGEIVGAPALLQHLNPELMARLYPEIEPLSLAATASHPVHPVQLYAALAGLLLAGGLLLLSRWCPRKGQLLCLLLVGYGLQRFALELLRGDHVHFVRVLGASLTVSQVVSCVLVPLGVVGFVVLEMRGRRARAEKMATLS